MTPKQQQKTTIFHDKDGGVYQGHVKDGKRHGKGISTNPSGMYQGEWKEDLKNGQGKLTILDGPTYEGEWKDDLKDGKGKMVFLDGSIYKGDWKEDAMHGIGKYIYPDGSIYEGEFKTNYKDGMGKLTYSDGSFEGGKWKDNKLIESNKIIIRIEDRGDIKKSWNIAVLLSDSVLEVKKKIQRLIGSTFSIILWLQEARLGSDVILSDAGIKNGDTLTMLAYKLSEEMFAKLNAYVSHDDENAITYEEFSTLNPFIRDLWIMDNISPHNLVTNETDWELLNIQRYYRANYAEKELPVFWMNIFCDIVLNTRFKFISLKTLTTIVDKLLLFYGYENRLGKITQCILQVIKKYESRQYHLGNTFLTSHANVVTIEEGLAPKFTDGENIYEAHSIIQPINMNKEEVIRIALAFDQSIGDKIADYELKKYRSQVLIYHRGKEFEWFQSGNTEAFAVGFFPLHDLAFINPYQEKLVSSDDQFWPHLSSSVETIPLSIQGLIYDSKSEGTVIIDYNDYKISGLASNGVFYKVTKYCDNGEIIKGSVKNKLLDGLIVMQHHSDNFREFSPKPKYTYLFYKEGVPLFKKKITIVYDNEDEESGLFFSKLSSSSPHRRILMEGTRTTQNLICDGIYDFRTGGLSNGQAIFSSRVQEDPRTRKEEETLISLRNISKGIYPHDDVYKGKWNPKNGILTKGDVTHKDGSIELIIEGQIVSERSRKLTKAPPRQFDKALVQSETRRKALQQLNMKRIAALHLGERNPKLSYKTALFANYAHYVGKTAASDSLRAPLKALFQQKQENKPLRKQFMRRLFQDEAPRKQLLEILLRILKLYEGNRKTIVTAIRDSLRHLEKKTLRRNGNVLPIVRKALFDALLTFPDMKEMDLIYTPFEGYETLVDLIYAMAPEELRLGDTIVKKINESGIDELSLLIDGLISTIVGNIAAHLPMKVLQKIQIGQAAPAAVVDEEEIEDAMIYVPQQAQPAQRPKQKQTPSDTDIEIELCSWNISWLDLRSNKQRLSKSIELLGLINFTSDFILLQETPFDTTQFKDFNEGLERADLKNLTLDVFHRAVVQPYLKIAGMTEQLHGMMIMVNRRKWDIVQRKRPRTYTIIPPKSEQEEASDALEDGGIVSSMPKSFFHSGTEIMEEPDLNRQAVWYSADPMKDEHHEPHLFTKLSTLSGLFQSKTHPSFYMIVMNIHVRKIGYNARYRTRLLKGINEQIRLYIGYVETIPGSSFKIVIGGDFNRSDQYIIPEILNDIPVLRSGHVIMNPTPIKKPSIDAFLIPDHVRFNHDDIQDVWQQRQRQLGDRLFPEGGHTPFKIVLTFPINKRLL